MLQRWDQHAIKSLIDEPFSFGANQHWNVFDMPDEMRIHWFDPRLKGDAAGDDNGCRQRRELFGGLSPHGSVEYAIDAN